MWGDHCWCSDRVNLCWCPFPDRAKAGDATAAPKATTMRSVFIRVLLRGAERAPRRCITFPFSTVIEVTQRSRSQSLLPPLSGPAGASDVNESSIRSPGLEQVARAWPCEVKALGKSLVRQKQGDANAEKFGDPASMPRVTNLPLVHRNLLPFSRS